MREPVAPGSRFGSLTAISKDGSRHRHSVWRCRCDCGNATTATPYDLRRGYRVSCGCHNNNWDFRKKQVISQLFQASNNQQIAGHCKVGIPTVKRWIKRIARELDIDPKKWIVRVRIVYLISQRRGHEQDTHSTFSADFLRYDVGAGQRAMPEPSRIM